MFNCILNMFSYYRDICDVVSLLVNCPTDSSYLLNKETSGDVWLPSYKVEKQCWKSTITKLTYELFLSGTDLPAVSLMRMSKVWLPGTSRGCVYHVIYKLSVKSDLKRKLKLGSRYRLQWCSLTDLEKHRAHKTLRSPELMVLVHMAVGESSLPGTDMEYGSLVEICEDQIVTPDASAASPLVQGPLSQLLTSAGYCAEDQIRLYREFLVQVYPALYMSSVIFRNFMVDLGWELQNCSNLFRAADVSGRGGLSFAELLQWVAALEPGTLHTGAAADARCRYIFRYYDTNRDLKLEYLEVKELVAASRLARQLAVDSVSVARDAELCYRQLELEPNTPLSFSDYMRGVTEQKLRGTSALLRAPRPVSLYLADLQEKDKVKTVSSEPSIPNASVPAAVAARADVASAERARRPPPPDYTIASRAVLLHNPARREMLSLNLYDEEVVTASSLRLLSRAPHSFEELGAVGAPEEALAAVRYFASCVAVKSRVSKSSWSWSAPAEEAALGALLLRLAEAARLVCQAEPRLLRVPSPVYVIGDLHGNLSALLAMEALLWPSGGALCPGKLLFLGDYVDRGPHGAELMAYLMALKLQRPRGVFLIRGNHEVRDIQKMFTFYNECISKYGETEGQKIWASINSVFDVLPLAAVVDDKVFCCHGGIPPPWVCPLISAIDKVPNPLVKPADQSTIAWELLWNDPVRQTKMTASLAMELATNEGFAANARRGTGHVFDQSALDRFLHANQLSHVLRAHEMQQAGFMCQLRGRLISVFSSSRYCGGNNDCGAALLEGGKVRLMRVVNEAPA